MTINQLFRKRPNQDAVLPILELFNLNGFNQDTRACVDLFIIHCQGSDSAGKNLTSAIQGLKLHHFISV